MEYARVFVKKLTILQTNDMMNGGSTMTKENNVNREVEAMTQLAEIINAKGDEGEIRRILERGERDDEPPATQPAES